MPDLNQEKYERLKQSETIINTVSTSSTILLKLSDQQTIKAIKKIQPHCSLLNRILSFLSKYKCLNSIYSFVKNNKFINSVINFLDRYLSVHPKITKLSFYNVLNKCGVAASVSSFIWFILELVGVIPKGKPKWLKFLDGTISVFGYLTGLAMDILDLIYNPNPVRKAAAVIEIILSTTSTVIHLYNLIKY